MTNNTDILVKIKNILEKINVNVSNKMTASNQITVNYGGIQNNIATYQVFNKAVIRFEEAIANICECKKEEPQKDGWYRQLGQFADDTNNIIDLAGDIKSFLFGKKSKGKTQGTPTPNTPVEVFVTGGKIKIEKSFFDKIKGYMDKGKTVKKLLDKVAGATKALSAGGGAGGGTIFLPERMSRPSKALPSGSKKPLLLGNGAKGAKGARGMARGKGLAKIFQKITKLFGPLGRALSGIGRAIRPLVGVIGRFLPMLGRLSVVLIGVAGPVAIVIGAILAIKTAIDIAVASFDWLWSNIASFRGFIAVIVEIGRQLLERVQGIFDTVVTKVSSFLVPVLEPLINLWNGIKQVIGSFFSSITDKLIKFGGVLGFDVKKLKAARKNAEENDDITLEEVISGKKKKKKGGAVTEGKGKTIEGGDVQSSSARITANNYQGLVINQGIAQGNVGKASAKRSQKSVNVQSLIGTLNINTQTIKESTGELKETVKRTLLEALRDVDKAQDINYAM